MALQEIESVSRDVDRAVLTGAYRVAAKRLVDYWNGDDSWAAMRPDARAELVRYVPKGCLDFRALIGEPTPLDAYRRFNFPVLLLQGEHTPEPTQLITRQLAGAIKFVVASTVSSNWPPRPPPGSNSAMRPAPASHGCSQPKRPAPKWAGPIRSLRPTQARFKESKPLCSGTSRRASKKGCSHGSG
jgi:hypothetical protein